MSDSVKFIFKTLFKVPIIIFVAYFILNLFAFAFTYFRMLGFSYVVMQTAVEHNYIPDEENSLLTSYLDSISDTGFIQNSRLVLNTVSDPGYDPNYNPANQKRQYGQAVRVGVAFEFKMVWPLMPHEQTNGKAVDGFNSGSSSTYLSDTELDSARENKSKWNTIVIDYVVPGLKYYPDLSI